MEHRRILRWGALAGGAGVVLAIASIAVQAAFVARLPASACGAACTIDASVGRFPAAKAALTVSYLLYLAALALFVVLLLALQQALKQQNPAPALFGGGLGVVGLTVLIAGSLPSVAFGHLSRLYHAPGATAGDRATLALVAHGLQAVLNELDTVGAALLTVGYVLLGVAMLRSPAFGRPFGVACIVLAAAALAGLLLISIGQENPNDVALALVVTVLPAILSWRLLRLSSGAARRLEEPAGGRR